MFVSFHFWKIRHSPFAIHHSNDVSNGPDRKNSPEKVVADRFFGRSIGPVHFDVNVRQP